MRILFVVPSLKCGGLERVASVLSSAWVREDGVSVTLVTLDCKAPFYALDGAVVLVPSPATVDSGPPYWKLFKKWFWLQRVARQASPDVVLSFGERYNAFVLGCLGGLTSTSGQRVPVCVGNRTTPHTSLVGVRGWVNPKAYRRAAVVFVQTERSREMLRAKYRDVRMVVLPNPIPDPLARATAGVDYSQEAIVSVGSFTGQKNQVALLRMFASLADDFPTWRLVFAGAGPKAGEAEQLAKSLGLAHRVAFLGNQEDVAQVHLQGSIFGFTSLLEGYPNALAEAMRSGLASVAYDCETGPADIITHGETGYLVPPGDESAFSGYLRQLMASRPLRERMGSAARGQTVHLDTAIVAQQYLAVFRGVVGG